MNDKGRSALWELVKLGASAGCVLAAVAIAFQSTRSATAGNTVSIGEDRAAIRGLQGQIEAMKDAMGRQNAEFLRLMAEQNEKTIRELGAMRADLAALRAGLEESRRGGGAERRQ